MFFFKYMFYCYIASFIEQFICFCMYLLYISIFEFNISYFSDGSSGRSPSTRAAAPRPPSHRHDDTESPSPQALSPTETGRSQRPSLPTLSPSPSTPSSAGSSPSTSMKHSSSAPPPPPPLCRRGNAPSPPSSSYNREKPLPPTPNNTPPLPSKPPPSPGNSRRPPTSGGNPASSSSSLAPPPPPYRITNGPTGGGGEAAPELPQRHNSLSNKRTAPSPGGHTPTRGPAPPPPPSPTPSQQGANRPPPPVRETPGRGAGEVMLPEVHYGKRRIDRRLYSYGFNFIFYLFLLNYSQIKCSELFFYITFII